MDLKTTRNRKNLSQVELAERIGVSEVQISRYENGHAMPRPAVRRRIEEALGPVSWERDLPLNADELKLLFRAMELTVHRMGVEEAFDLLGDSSPDELRKMIKLILTEQEKLLPPGVEGDSPPPQYVVAKAREKKIPLQQGYVKEKKGR